MHKHVNWPLAAHWVSLNRYARKAPFLVPSKSSSIPTSRRSESLLVASLLLLPAVPPINLLLQNNAIHAGLEQGEGQARLPFEVAESIENLGAGVGGEVVERRRQLLQRPPTSALLPRKTAVAKMEGAGCGQKVGGDEDGAGRLDGGGTFFMFSASRSYSSSTSCCRGVSSGWERRFVD